MSHPHEPAPNRTGPQHVDSLFADPRCYTAVTGLPKPIGFDHPDGGVVTATIGVTTAYELAAA